MTTEEAQEQLGRHRASKRVLAGLTQEQLAEAAGVTRNTVSRAEQGLPIAEDSIRRLAAACSVPAADYLGPDIPVPTSTESSR